MKRGLIFLDCDGVLSAVRAGSNRGLYLCRFRPHCMRQLNRIVRETRAAIVVSSSWRYAIHSGMMSPWGFEVMLRAAGGQCLNVLGPTRKDLEPWDSDTRGRQCRDWLEIHGRDFGRCVALDDDDDGFAEHGIPLVQTNPRRGLTGADAERVIGILMGTGTCNVKRSI